MALDIAEVDAWLMARFEGLAPRDSWGERSYFCNPGGKAARGTYFLTIKEKDGANDRASDLDRPGIWRLNFGLPKAEFMRLFGHPPARPGKGQVIEGPWDFTALDQLTPHPVYGWAAWVAILSPSVETYEELKPLIALAYGKSRVAFQKR
jgi:hypothetical protein